MMPFQPTARKYGLLVGVFGMLIPLASPLAADNSPTGQGMVDFIKKHPDCVEFNDQCSICAIVVGKLNCSTPSIACIKKEYVCTRSTGG
jgi:hypothetical protein